LQEKVNIFPLRKVEGLKKFLFPEKVREQEKGIRRIGIIFNQVKRGF
jgi:hypothetical protein